MALVAPAVFAAGVFFTPTIRAPFAITRKNRRQRPPALPRPIYRRRHFGICVYRPI